MINGLTAPQRPLWPPQLLSAFSDWAKLALYAMRISAPISGPSEDLIDVDGVIWRIALDFLVKAKQFIRDTGIALVPFFLRN